MRERSSRFSDLTLERYALGELPLAARREVAAALATDPDLRARLEALEASNALLLAAHPPEATARRLLDRLRRDRVEAELRGESPLRRSLPGWARPAAVTALLIAVVAGPGWRLLQGDGRIISERPVATNPASNAPGVSGTTSGTTGIDGAGTGETSVETPTRGDEIPTGASGEASPAGKSPAPASASRTTEDAPDTRPSDTRLKGLEPTLALFRKTPQGAEPLRPGAKARPGDVLRIGYRAAGRSYGAIFSVDGHGNVTRHWPLEGDKAARLEAGEHLLPGAFELDAAPDYERFYLLVSERAFPLPIVLEALHANKPPAPGKDVTVVRFDLMKDNGI